MIELIVVPSPSSPPHSGWGTIRGEVSSSVAALAASGVWAIVRGPLDLPAVAGAHIAAANPRTLALSGGETPAPVYRRLAGSGLPWSGIDVFFADERCVPPGDSGSNYRMADETLLSRVPARVHRMPGETCDARAYEAALAAVFGPGVPIFDLVVLGLGADGHTASLFPGDPALEVTDRNVVCVSRPDYDRMTLTLPVLSAAKEALFLVAGGSKRAALRRMLDGEDLPASRVRAARVVVIADEAAAGVSASI